MIPTRPQLLLLIWSLAIALTAASQLTPIHAPGYCSIYNNCGKKSFFGSELPCPNNIKAKIPSQQSLNLLTEICGSDFDFSKVCCSHDQILNLQSNLKKVDPLISSCPACKQNFYNFFCNFTCSPDQSTFVDINSIGRSTSGNEIVTELTQYIDPEYAAKFYDSCKYLKFSATNGYAMDLIGGGAKNYSSFLKFLGDEKPMLGGSPFQINFKYNITESDNDLELSYGTARDCDDEEYKCACSDCLSSCPTLPTLKPSKTCKVGSVSCFSFYIIFIYAFGLVIFTYFIHQKPKILLDEIDADISQQTQHHPLIPKTSINSSLKQFFQKLSFYCASFPAVTITISSIVIILLSSGLTKLSIETNAVNLWVSPDEPALHQLNYFQDNFGEWFRIEQIIVKSPDNVLDYDTIKWWFEKELELQSFVVDNETIELNDICFKPLGESCAIESFTQYFNGDISAISPANWESKLKGCVSSPVNCLPSFQQPLKKELLFGGYQDEDVLTSKAFVVTLLVNQDTKDFPYLDKVVKYEKELQKWLVDLQIEAKDRNLEISYSTEISLEQELNKSTNTDIKIIIISYLVMFFYASLALGGRIPSSLSSFTKTRFQLGFSGIILVLLSITSSMGFFSYLGLKSTLIIAEVIPFLTLAIGIDNIFLIIEQLDKVNSRFPNLSVEYRISKTLGEIGPSCLISATIQFLTLLLATQVQMPAVKNFAYYSAGAILVNFILQMSVFVSILSLDQKRLESNRVDCLPFLKLTNTDVELNSTNKKNIFNVTITDYFAPYILSKKARRILFLVFMSWFGISLSLLPQIKFGLDQRIAIPSDSHLVDYFNDIYQYLNVGPPVFFIVKDSNVTDLSNQQKICGKFSTCNEFSMVNILEQEFLRLNQSTIAEPTSSWLDDFLTWLNPELDECCRVSKKSLSLDKPEFCSPYDSPRACQSCFADHDPKYDITMKGFPQGEEFMFYFNHWIEQASDPCPLGGKAPYSNSISVVDNKIESSYYRTSHKPLRSQDDFIDAYKQSLRITNEIKKLTDLDVFAFSPFYIFFVQYVSIVKLTFTLISIALLIIWIISAFLINSWRNSSLLILTVLMILTNIGGVMSVWSISLNAVSLVNLIICIGLAVEFCIHITRNFTMNNGESVGLNQQEKYDLKTSKAFNSLRNIGGSVLGGITMTKFIGICVLAFTRSQIFEIYYFRMWLSLIIIASAHSLCFLPILLSFFGDDKINQEEESDDQFGERFEGLRENYSEEE